jgi:hypothetical protein
MQITEKEARDQIYQLSDSIRAGRKREPSIDPSELEPHKKSLNSFQSQLDNLIKNYLTTYKPFHICLIAEKFQGDSGLGDIIFMLKIASIAEKHFGKTARISIYALTDLEMEALNQESMRARIPAGVELLPIEKMPQDNSAAIILHGPVLLSDHPIFSSSLKIWHLSEYSYIYLNSDSASYTKKLNSTSVSGLGKEEVGIFVPDPQRELLKQELLSEKAENPLIRYIRKDCEDRFFYFGYSHNSSPLISFILCCLYHAKNNNKPFIDVCIPGSKIKSAARFPLFYSRLIAAIPRFLLDSSLRNIEFYLGSKEWSSEFQCISSKEFHLIDTSTKPLYHLLDLSEKGTQTLRILLPGSLSEKDMSLCLEKSESNFTLVTGDQSLSEALNKKCMIEIRCHKEESIEYLQNRAEEYGFALLAKFIALAKCPTGQINTSVEQIARIIDSSELEKEIVSFCEKIRKEHNLETTITEKIEESIRKKSKTLFYKSAEKPDSSKT